MIADDNIPGKEACADSLKYVMDALYVLGGKWKLPVILCIVQSSKRFNEIQHAVSGISPKVLAKELKDLEMNDFIRRHVYTTTPVSIVYEATEYSLSLKNVLRELSTWGGQHRERIRKSMSKKAYL
jgi:DNA-binding HxlR family transcriptional regulator